MTETAAKIILNFLRRRLARRLLALYRRGILVQFPHSVQKSPVQMEIAGREPIPMSWSTAIGCHWAVAPPAPGHLEVAFRWIGRRLVTDRYPFIRKGTEFWNVMEVPDWAPDCSTTASISSRRSSNTKSQEAHVPSTLATVVDVLPPALLNDREDQEEADEFIQSNSSLLASRHANFFRPLHVGNRKPLIMPTVKALTRSSHSIHDLERLSDASNRGMPRVFSSSAMPQSAFKPPPVRVRRHSTGSELKRSTEIRPLEYFSRNLPHVESYCILPTSSRAPCVWPSAVLAELAGHQDAASRLRMFAILQSVQLAKPHNCDFFKCNFGTFRARPRVRSQLGLMGGAYNIPKPGEPFGGGEDAYFVSDDPDVPAAGVADGVGDFRNYGINPRDFSQALMDYSLEYLKENKNSLGDKKMSQHLRAVLRYAHQKAKEQPNCLGASTAVIVAMNQTGTSLGITVLGDSTVIQFRRDADNCLRMLNIFKANEQQHIFNCPFQLSALPSVEQMEQTIDRLNSSPDGDLNIRENYMALLENTKLGQVPKADTPGAAQLYDISVMEGDLIILMTDGVSDNIFVPEMQELVSHALSPYEGDLFVKAMTACCGSKVVDAWREGKFAGVPSVIKPPVGCMYTDPQAVAKGIAMAAVSRFWDSRAYCPFGDAARRQFRHMRAEDALGGKMDDATVAALWVVPRESR